MWRLRLCLALAALLLGLPARGVQYVNDELLWTKQTWGEYQLDFPWQFFAKREPEVARLLEAEPYLASSLNGPQGDIREEVERDIKRWGGGGGCGIAAIGPALLLRGSGPPPPVCRLLARLRACCAQRGAFVILQ